VLVRQLHVVVEGDGSIVSMPEGITCGADCDHGYLDGTRVVLRASPSPGWFPAVWTGCERDAGDPLSCSVTLASDVDVTVAFQPTLIITTTDAQPGESVEPDPPGTPCGPGCTAHPRDTSLGVVVNAPADRGADFARVRSPPGSSTFER
jgi:hypothetical protein